MPPDRSFSDSQRPDSGCAGPSRSDSGSRESERRDFARPTFSFDDPRVRHCAQHWAAQLRRQHIVDTDADDLLQEAWVRAQRALGADDVENPLAFVCTIIERLALMRMRRQRTRRIDSVDPSTGPLAAAVAPDRPLREAMTRLAVDEVLRFLDRHRDQIWTAAIEVFGESRRAESMWAAARLATLHLVVQDNNWTIDETLDASMRQSDDWWRSERRDGETSDEAAERGRKRIARDRPWVSYITLLEAMMWLHLDNRGARAELVAHHLRHIQIHLREAQARRQVKRVAALRKHIAEIESNVG